MFIEVLIVQFFNVFDKICDHEKEAGWIKHVWAFLCKFDLNHVKPRDHIEIKHR